MTSDLAEDRTGRASRFFQAFRYWRRSRPFWGGLWLLFSGTVIFFSGNLSLGNLQVHMGVEGFKSYIIPLILWLCGALIWASPSQRIFYGAIAIASAIYSLVAVNLGGFVVGMLSGMAGGALAIAWVPNKDTFEHSDEATGDDDDDDRFDDPDGTAETAEVPRPRHAAYDEDDAPVPAETAGDSGTAEFTAAGPRYHRGPRIVTAAVIALTVLAAGFVGLRDATPAAAAGCTPVTLTQQLKTAKATPHRKLKPATTSKSAKKKTPTTTGAAPLGAAPVAHVARAGGGTAAPDPGSLLGLIGGLLGVGATASPSATPSADPTETPDPSPSPSAKPSAPATPSPSAKPSPKPSVTVSGTTAPHKPPRIPTPTPSASVPPCKVIGKMLALSGGQPTIGSKPGTMTVDLLTMTGLSYDGNVELPTKDGTIEVMQFSMDSSTSTPFQLDADEGSSSIRTESSKLTVSGHVKFYATEIKGNVLGVLPADYTPSAPPPITPSLLFFTNVTIGLAFVTCDTLTADKLTLTPLK